LISLRRVLVFCAVSFWKICAESHGPLRSGHGKALGQAAALPRGEALLSCHSPEGTPLRDDVRSEATKNLIRSLAKVKP
jgi:hypothetical protein